MTFQRAFKRLSDIGIIPRQRQTQTVELIGAEPDALEMGLLHLAHSFATTPMEQFLASLLS